MERLTETFKAHLCRARGYLSSPVAKQSWRRYGLTQIVLMLFLTLTLDGTEASELFSVRCEGGSPARPYFATFDVDAKKVVFESPPTNAETYGGINVFVGEINSSDNRPDGQIEFTIRLTPGKLSLIFDGNRKRMIWPGLPNDTAFRPTLTHSCAVISSRSILSFRLRDPVLHPVSVQCEEDGYMYFTMDTESKRAIFERGAVGRGYDGEVTAVKDDNIILLMTFDTPRQVTWNKQRQTITIEGVEGDANRARKTMHCKEIAPRTMIEYYQILRRQ